MANNEHPDNDGIVHYEAGIPVFNKRLNDLEDEARKAKDRDDQYKDEQLKLNRRLVWFTGVLAAVGLIGGAISGYQAHVAKINADAARDNADAAKGMVEEMKKSSTDTHDLAVAAKGQASAAQAAATAAQGTVRILKEQFQKDQRPYVAIVGCQMLAFKTKTAGIATHGEPLMVSVEFKNVGKSPALNLRFHRHVIFGQAIFDQLRPDPIDSKKTDDTFDQGETSFTTAISLKDTFSNDTADVRDDEMLTWNGAEPVIAFGRFTYEDDFGHSYCTPFARRLLNPTTWENITFLEQKSSGFAFRVANLCPPQTKTRRPSRRPF